MEIPPFSWWILLSHRSESLRPSYWSTWRKKRVLETNLNHLIFEKNMNTNSLVNHGGVAGEHVDPNTIARFGISCTTDGVKTLKKSKWVSEVITFYWCSMKKKHLQPQNPPSCLWTSGWWRAAIAAVRGQILQLDPAQFCFFFHICYLITKKSIIFLYLVWVRLHFIPVLC